MTTQKASRRLNFTPLLLALLAMPLIVAGCGNSDDMSQREVEYLSHMDQARFFQRQGELRASTQEVRSAMAAQPEEADPYFLLIDNLLTAGDGASAERQIVQLRENMQASDDDLPMEILNRLWLLQARAQVKQEQHENALESLDNLSDPTSSQQIQALLTEGDAHRLLAQFERAEAAYNAAREMDEEDTMPLLGLSRVAFDTNRRDRARELLAQAEELDPEDSEVWLWKAQMAHQLEDLETAQDAYTRALEDIGRFDVMTQKKYVTISALIDVLQRRGNASQAFVYEEILASSAPGTIRANMESARTYYERGDLDRAASSLNEVLQQNPGHQNASILLGMIRFQQGRVEEAEELLAPFADQDLSESDEITKMLAATRIQLQRPEEAREMLTKLDPDQSDPGVMALMGIATLAGGDQELGESLIEGALEATPDNAGLRARYARYLLSINEPDRAIEQLKTGIAAAPEADNLRILLAQIYLQADDADAAVALTRQWREDQPRNIRAISSSGDVAQATGNMSEARRFYRRSIEVDPSAGESHYALGALEAREGNMDQANRHFRDALKAAPENENALRTLLSLNRDDPDSLADTIDFLKAVVDDNESVIGPRLAILEYNLQENDFTEASRIADRLRRQIDDNDRSQSLIGSIYHGVAARALSNNELDKARDVIRAGRERYRHHEQLALADARLQFARGREREAREILRSVKTQYPDSAQPYLTEADYFMRQNKYRQAVEQYGLAREKQDSPETVIRMAFAHRQDGQTIRSVELLEKGAETFPRNERLLLNLAMAYQAEDEEDKAVEAYQRTLNVAPNNAVALNNLAWIYHERGNDDARELAERAYQLNPNSPEIADTYGWILFNQGEVDESIRILESAHEMAPDSEGITRHLVEAYRAAGRDDDAEALQQRI